MPEVNRVPFKFDPVPGDLFLDHHRRNFYMERLDDVVDTLSTLCMDRNVVSEVEGEVRFVDEAGTPPEIRGLRYSNMARRMEKPDPFGSVDEPVVVE